MTLSFRRLVPVIFDVVVVFVVVVTKAVAVLRPSMKDLPPPIDDDDVEKEVVNPAT